MRRVAACTALLAVSVLLVSCGSMPTPFQKSPGDVVKAFYRAANEGRYSEAEQMMSEDAKAFLKGELGQLAGGFKGIVDKMTKNGTIVSVDIEREQIRGEGATVTGKVSYKDGSSEEKGESLIKENGSWKLTVGK
jgi:hypothetical protein